MGPHALSLLARAHAVRCVHLSPGAPSPWLIADSKSGKGILKNRKNTLTAPLRACVRHNALARTPELPTSFSPARAQLCESDPGFQDTSRRKTGGELQTQPRPYRRFHCGKLGWGKYAQFSEQFCAWDGDQDR